MIQRFENLHMYKSMPKPAVVVIIEFQISKEKKFRSTWVHESKFYEMLFI